MWQVGVQDGPRGGDPRGVRRHGRRGRQSRDGRRARGRVPRGGPRRRARRRLLPRRRLLGAHLAVRRRPRRARRQRVPRHRRQSPGLRSHGTRRAHRHHARRLPRRLRCGPRPRPRRGSCREHGRHLRLALCSARRRRRLPLGGGVDRGPRGRCGRADALRVRRRGPAPRHRRQVPRAVPELGPRRLRQRPAPVLPARPRRCETLHRPRPCFCRGQRRSRGRRPPHRAGAVVVRSGATT
mmetsp:Transcript_22807/g.90453  ORF Transcript_22807/g.90453 Transcript_22807/m.90453 type:complete len:239 (-) Transcript_22807:675-1391(-)